MMETELDRWLGEHVMGWTWVEGVHGAKYKGRPRKPLLPSYWRHPDGDSTSDAWSPSSRIADAMDDIVPAMQKHELRLILFLHPSGEWEARFCVSEHGRAAFSFAKTHALAISRAARAAQLEMLPLEILP